MNHLAHLFLAAPTPESLLGNLSGDFVKGRLDDRFPPGVRQGIVEHRRIDAFTDTHPAVGVFRRIIGEEYGHYARVIADMFFDHFLASEWDRYSSEMLDAFLVRVFATLDPHVAAMPGRLQFVYPRMRDEGWLLSYRRIEGIREALFSMSRRFSRQPQLEGSVHLLEDARPELLELFHQAFPDVIRFAGAIRSAR